MENPPDEGPRREGDDANADSRAIEQLDSEPFCPVKIHSDPHSEVWYKSDIKLGLPESYAYIQYISPLGSASAKNAAMQEMFVRILQKSLPDELKSAIDTEGMNYRVFDSYKGLSMQASGLNQKLPHLLEAITKCVTQGSNFVTEDLFKVNKDDLLKQYATCFLESDQLAEMLVYSMKTLICWTPIHRYTAIYTVEFPEFQEYLNNFIEQIYIRSFVQGNLTESDAIQSIQNCVQILNSKVLPPDAVPSLRENVIPRGVRCCRVQSFDPHNLYSYTTNYYQFENPSMKLTLMIDVFGGAIAPDMMQPAYRNSIIGLKGLMENLIFEETGYFITVRSDDDFTVADVDGWIEEFRKKFNAKFRKMTDDDLRRIKEKVIEKKVKELVVAGSREEVCENWNAIITEQFIFDRQARELDILRDMSLKEFREWMVNLSMNESDRRLRKLTSQVVGYDEAWDETPEWDEAQRRLKYDRSNIHTLTYPLKYLTHVTDDGRGKPRGCYITNIERYKRRLRTFPDNQPTM